MRQISLALLGFGNVGKAFVRLLLAKKSVLQKVFDTEIIVTGIMTGSHGYAINTGGLGLERALEVAGKGQNLKILSDVQADNMDVINFLYTSSSEFLIESTPLNPFDGQPALSHLKNALTSGKHVVTANKGPLVYGYSELLAAAEQHGKGFYFESTVMDGAPIFSLVRETLPGIQVNAFTGILNSCTNYLLDLMAEGDSFEEAVSKAQSIGIAETDPTADIDGFDAAIKVAALSTVVFGIPLTTLQVERSGIRDITPEMIKEARQAGEKWKLIASARRKDNNLLHATVKPERVNAASPYYNINGTSSYVQFETDVLPGLGIVENNPGPQTTAYGMFADMLNIIRKYY